MRNVSYSFEIEFLRRIGRSFSSPMLNRLGDKRALTLFLAVLNQEGSFFGVVGNMKSMLSVFHSQHP